MTSSTSSSTTATTTTTASSTETSTCSPKPIPSVVPPGWVEYTDWSCSCRFYVPPSKEALPPPLEWGACPGPALSYDCRRLVVPGTETTYTTGVSPALTVLPDDTALLLLNHPDHTQQDTIPNMHVVAEVDGPVRSAILDVLPAATNPRCVLVTMRGTGRRHVLGVKGDGAAGSDYASTTIEGAMGGDIDDLRPSVLARVDDGETYEWVGSDDYIVRVGAPSFRVQAQGWSLGKPVVVASPASDPDHLRIYEETPVAGAIFFLASSGLLSGISVWTPSTGARPFIRWVGDVTRGAGSFGTDGADIAWRYGEGRDASGYYETVSLVTAKYTTDPGAVVPRLAFAGLARRDALSPEPVAVGCGYAATANVGKGQLGGNTLIVRLADGRHWDAPGTSAVLHHHVVGVTCSDVYVAAALGPATTIIRIALASLGPGEPMK